MIYKTILFQIFTFKIVACNFQEINSILFSAVPMDRKNYSNNVCSCLNDSPVNTLDAFRFSWSAAILCSLHMNGAKNMWVSPLL